MGPNTPGADLQYERQVQNWLVQYSECSKSGVTFIDINVVQRCVDKMKSKKLEVYKELTLLMLKESIMDALTVSCLFVEKVEK